MLKVLFERLRPSSSTKLVSTRYFSSRDTSDFGIDFNDDVMFDEYINEGSPAFYPLLNVNKQSAKPIVSSNLNVMVVQPWEGLQKFETYTTPDIQLAECVSLANTLKNWAVVGKKIITSSGLFRKNVFPKPVFEEFKHELKRRGNVTGLLLGVDILGAVQKASLEEELQIPVYDRFTTVLNIFRQHARTKEAKIQIALAELPYIRQHLREINTSAESLSSYESLKFIIGGLGESYFHKRQAILKKREIVLRKLFSDLKSQREVEKKARKKNRIPTVSLVGYTNSGKTTLAKYLTSDDTLEPHDQLFATLDVTVHKGSLPSNDTVLFVDTVGFISRIPSLLVEAFSQTLAEVNESDLIVHILDVSHPDHKLQYHTVEKALQDLNVPKRLISTMINVGNKVDKLGPDVDIQKLPQCDVKIAATKGQNCKELVQEIDRRLFQNLSQKVAQVKVSNGGQDFVWLQRHCTILKCEPDEADGNILICDAIFGDAQIGRWKKNFLNEIKFIKDEQHY